VLDGLLVHTTKGRKEGRKEGRKKGRKGGRKEYIVCAERN
jgi:hypothetical protein